MSQVGESHRAPAIDLASTSLCPPAEGQRPLLCGSLPKRHRHRGAAPFSGTRSCVILRTSDRSCAARSPWPGSALTWKAESQAGRPLPGVRGVGRRPPCAAHVPAPASDGPGRGPAPPRPISQAPGRTCTLRVHSIRKHALCRQVCGHTHACARPTRDEVPKRNHEAVARRCCLMDGRLAAQRPAHGTGGPAPGQGSPGSPTGNGAGGRERRLGAFPPGPGRQPIPKGSGTQSGRAGARPGHQGATGPSRAGCAPSRRQ